VGTQLPNVDRKKNNKEEEEKELIVGLEKKTTSTHCAKAWRPTGFKSTLLERTTQVGEQPTAKTVEACAVKGFSPHWDSAA